MQLFVHLGKLLLVTISRVHWIGHVNRMAGKRKVRRVFSNNPKEVD
jgi:hypothetical protein